MSITAFYDPSIRAVTGAGGRRASLAVLISDAIALFCALMLAGVCANLIRAALHLDSLAVFSQTHADHVMTTAVLSATMILWLAARRHYSTRQTFSNQTKDIFLACIGALMAAAFLDFATKSDMPRLSVFLTWGFAAILMIHGRRLAKGVLMAHQCWFTPVIMLGSPEREAHFAHVTKIHTDLGFKIASAFDIDAVLDLVRDHPDARARAALEGAMEQAQAKHFLLAPGAEDYKQALELIEILQRLRVPFVFAPQTGMMSVSNLMVQSLSPSDGMMITPFDSLDRPAARAAKEIGERAAAGLALILLSPIFAIISILIARDGGPVFFHQERLGQGGRRFSCLKFRSMAPDAAERLAHVLREDPEAAAEWAQRQKLANDPRITPIGNFLRRTSLDELPQLINVLRGDMSIVGPRPVVPDEITKYGKRASYYLRVKPGLTGLWQVNGRNNVSYEERIRLDSYYVRNWTLWRDVCVAFKTIPEMLWTRSGI